MKRAMKSLRHRASCGLVAAVVGGWLHCLAEVANAQTVKSAISPDSTWTIPSNEEILALLAARMQHNGVGIVIGIIEPRSRRVVVYGKRSVGDARPLDGDTIFQIGSVTKVFTGLLLADMIQRGEVRLDDPVVKYLPPQSQMPVRVRPITLFDLATHVSGLPSMPSNFDLHGVPNPYAAFTEKQLYAFLSTYELPYEPGTRSAYSNLGVALLGHLLARRMETDYESLLRERILKPLGMNDTAIKLTSDQTQRLAPGHDRFLQPVQTWELHAMPASGSLRSTANDMLKLLAAYLDDTGGTDTSLKIAMEFQRSTRQPENGSGALGLSVRKSKGEEQFGHDGGKEGYRTCFGFNPQRRTGTIVLVNARIDDPPCNIALHITTGRPLEPAPRAQAHPRRVTLTGKVLAAYGGHYRVSANEVIAIARKGEHLLVDTLSDGISSFYPYGPKAFYSQYGQEIVFELDDTGRGIALLLREGDKERRAERIADGLVK